MPTLLGQLGVSSFCWLAGKSLSMHSKMADWLISFRIGLWVLSGQGCAGLCGPRYRWEEEDMTEKATGPHSFADNVSEQLDAPLPWTWRENTVIRVYEAWEFCLTNKMPSRSGGEIGEKKNDSEREGGMAFEGMEKVFAAVGLGGGPPQPARRGILSGELFETPESPHEKEEVGAGPIEETDLTPPPSAQIKEKKTTTAGVSSPLQKLPYPFTGYGAQVSSEDVIPFPPSPVPPEEQHSGGDTSGSHDEQVEGEEAVVTDPSDGLEGELEESDVPSDDRRTSESMSSLGRPIVSRYPFQYRRPGRGGSMSSASQIVPGTNFSTPVSHAHSSQPSSSTQSGSTRFSRSTGNAESSDSPLSNGSFNVPSPPTRGSGIPMPPGHPRGGRRPRAGTVPAINSPQSSPSPVVFPRPRNRTRTESVATETTFGGPAPLPGFETSDDEEEDSFARHDESLMDVPEAEGSVEEAEQHDSVGLLSLGPSPRTSLTNLQQFGSRLSLHRGAGSRSRSTHSRSQSRSRTNSAHSISESARSRAQSLIQSLNAASRSSVYLVRSRANSMARLSDSPYYSTSPDPMPSSPENYTFGHPIREQWRPREPFQPESRRDDISEAIGIPLPPSESSSSSDSESDVLTDPQDVTLQHDREETQATLRPRPSILSGRAPSEHNSEGSGHTEHLAVPIPIPRRPGQPQSHPYGESPPDISTANASFITAPATIEGRTDTSGRTPSSHGGMEHYAPGGAWQGPA